MRKKIGTEMFQLNCLLKFNIPRGVN